MDEQKIILKAFEEEHELLESEKKALDDLFNEIKHEEKLLDEECSSVEGIKNLIEHIEGEEEFLFEQVKKKEQDPEAVHASYDDIKYKLDKLEDSLATLRKIHNKIKQARDEEIHEALETAEKNWEVVDLLRHAIERAERTKHAVEKLFREKLGD